jgi:hypothetical protein
LQVQTKFDTHIHRQQKCRAAILNHLPEKKKDPGCPTITCTIGSQRFDHALCDLGASVSVMPKGSLRLAQLYEIVPNQLAAATSQFISTVPSGDSREHPGESARLFHPGGFCGRQHGHW